MSGTRIGRWREDLLPRTHIMAERRVAKDSRHLSQKINNEIKWIGLVGFKVTRLLGHGPQLLRGLCPVHVLGGGGRTCCLEHT